MESAGSLSSRWDLAAGHVLVTRQCWGCWWCRALGELSAMELEFCIICLLMDSCLESLAVEPPVYLLGAGQCKNTAGLDSGEHM